MQLSVQIAARIAPEIKRNIVREVRRRRARGEGVDAADVIREALIRHFERTPETERCDCGKAVAV